MAAASLALTQVLNRASTTTALASSVNPSGYRQSVTFTATVSSGGPATGPSVQFFRRHDLAGGTIALRRGNASHAFDFKPSGGFAIDYLRLRWRCEQRRQHFAHFDEDSRDRNHLFNLRHD